MLRMNSVGRFRQWTAIAALAAFCAHPACATQILRGSLTDDYKKASQWAQGFAAGDSSQSNQTDPQKQPPPSTPDSQIRQAPQVQGKPVESTVQVRIAVLEKGSGDHVRVHRGLTKNDIAIYENGKPVEIRDVKPLSDEPMSVVFLLEWRGFFPDQSIYYSRYVYYDYLSIFWQMAAGANEFVARLDKEDDEVAVYTYGYLRSGGGYSMADCSKKETEAARLDCVEEDNNRFLEQQLTDFTSNKAKAASEIAGLQAQIANTRIPPTYTPFPGFLDTLDQVVRRLEKKPGRKAIVVVGTGVDTFRNVGGRKDFLKRLSNKDIQIFAVGIGTNLLESWAQQHRLPITEDYTAGDASLRQLAAITGGYYYPAKYTGAAVDLTSFYKEIFRISRNPYLVTYVPAHPPVEGEKLPKLKVIPLQVDEDDQPLLDKKGRPQRLKKMQDRKGNKVHLEVYAPERRPGYEPPPIHPESGQ